MPSGDYDDDIRGSMTQLLLSDKGRFPGYTGNNRQRSESTLNEQARRGLEENPPPSLMTHVFNPQTAQLIDAIRRNIMEQKQQTGYYKQPGIQGEYQEMHENPNYFKGK